MLDIIIKNGNCYIEGNLQKKDIGKGGIVKDSFLHHKVCEEITLWLTKSSSSKPLTYRINSSSRPMLFSACSATLFFILTKSSKDFLFRHKFKIASNSQKKYGISCLRK